MAEEKKVITSKHPKYMMNRFSVEVPVSYAILQSDVEEGLPENILLLGDLHHEDPRAPGADAHLGEFLSLFDKKDTLFVLENYKPLDDDKKGEFKHPIERYLGQKGIYYINNVHYDERWASGSDIAMIDERVRSGLPLAICESVLSFRVGEGYTKINKTNLDLFKHYYDQLLEIPLYNEFIGLMDRVKKCRTASGLRSIIFRLLRRVRKRQLGYFNNLKQVYNFALYNYKVQIKFWNYSFDPVIKSRQFLVKIDEANYTYYSKPGSSALYTGIDKIVYKITPSENKDGKYDWEKIIDMQDKEDFPERPCFLFYGNIIIVVDSYAQRRYLNNMFIIHGTYVDQYTYSGNVFSDFGDGSVYFINSVKVDGKMGGDNISYTVEYFNSINIKYEHVPQLRLPFINCESNDLFTFELFDSSFLSLLCEVEDSYKNVVLYCGRKHVDHLTKVLVKNDLYRVVAHQKSKKFLISFNQKAIQYLVENFGLNWRDMVAHKLREWTTNFNDFANLMMDNNVDVNEKILASIQLMETFLDGEEYILINVTRGIDIRNMIVKLFDANRRSFKQYGDPTLLKRFVMLGRKLGLVG